ncbi:uncharacterized protein E5676_scaffold506G00820 [Cucumis melo var. makuwa]|uniref:Uncharacterized protein n=1 Tax=Cucumis melo var. makuwa TaxID=1194695 RepID=A0A5D3BCJ8_CUCMM|nr:uncharacterized protein E6C27_scaffold270G002520 [Cucumis melo var. makuwa]TYJ97023.1 uncharacterized protein E5676_scaffold506G00820 [Cucumis melo var. makuwa]
MGKYVKEMKWRMKLIVLCVKQQTSMKAHIWEKRTSFMTISFVPDRGHVRGFGFGLTRSKLSLLSQQDHKYKVLEKEYLKMKEEMVEMKTMKDEMIEMKALMLSYLKKQTEPSEELSNATASVLKRLNIPSMPSPSSINNNSQTKCKLLDWYGSGEIVAEGR